MPQLELSNYPEQIIWFCLSFLILYTLISKWVVPAIVSINNKRNFKIINDKAAAEEIIKQIDSIKAIISKEEEKISLLYAKLLDDAKLSIEKYEHQKYEELQNKIDKLKLQFEEELSQIKAQYNHEFEEAAAKYASFLIKSIYGVDIPKELFLKVL